MKIKEKKKVEMVSSEVRECLCWEGLQLIVPKYPSARTLYIIGEMMTSDSVS